jgi:quaternary ammonium compound-resistance protein SugE
MLFSIEDGLNTSPQVQGRPWYLSVVVMPWILLLVAGLFEIVWAVGLKYTEGFSRLWPTLGTFVALLASVSFLAAAAKSLPIGTAYAVWTGIGALGTALIGSILLGDPTSFARVLCMVFIAIGVIGLKFT